MIRVANVQALGYFGGPQHRAVQVAERLFEHDIHTTVILPREGSDETVERLVAAGVPVLRLPMHRLTRQKSHLAGFALMFGPELALLVAALLRERADIVHCNGAWQVKSVLAGRLAGKRVALHVNDTFTTPAMSLLYRMVAPLCDGYIFSGERAKAAHPAAAGRADAVIETIPAPVDTARFDPSITEPDAGLAAAPGQHVITVGMVNPAKGLEHFVALAAAIRRVRSDATFHVIGGQLDSQRQYFADVKRQAGDLLSGALTFRGPSTDMPAVYRAADIYVCSSVAEASPMAVWEAMSMALPIVSTDVGDVARYVEEGRSGFIVPVGDVSALADRVTRLLDDPERRRAMGEHARRTAVERLDLSRCVALHRSFYHALLESRRPVGGRTAGRNRAADAVRPA
ncbi:MAG: glycosyltransferase family 4 protein [Deltaproteobacteria bacterium]|nr:glycosyltransferase family 4 protein [Deltaproteobacteria bacterium]